MRDSASANCSMPMSCPLCGSNMRLVGTTDTEPSKRRWECINHHKGGERACPGIVSTDAEIALSAQDIAHYLHNGEPDNPFQRPGPLYNTGELAHKLRISMAHQQGVYRFLSSTEHTTLAQAMTIVAKLASADQQLQELDQNRADEKEWSNAMESYQHFAADCEPNMLMQRCRCLDHHLKDDTNQDTRIEEAVDQVIESRSPADKERAMATLAYRVGLAWVLIPQFMQARFERRWRTWQALDSFRTSINQILDQENEL